MDNDEQQLSVAERKAQAKTAIEANEARISQLEQRSKTHALKNEFAQIEHLRREIDSLRLGISNMRVLITALEELEAKAKAEAKRLHAAYGEADSNERSLNKEVDAAYARFVAAEREIAQAEQAHLQAKNAHGQAFSRLCRVRAELENHKNDFPELHQSKAS